MGALGAGLVACVPMVFIPVPPPRGTRPKEKPPIWGKPLDHGTIVVELERHRDHGPFVVEIELAANNAALTVDAKDVSLDVLGQQSAAELPPDEASPLKVPPGSTERLRLIFSPRGATWEKGTTGDLEVTVSDGERRRTFWVPVAYDFLP